MLATLPCSPISLLILPRVLPTTPLERRHSLPHFNFAGKVWVPKVRSSFAMEAAKASLIVPSACSAIARLAFRKTRSGASFSPWVTDLGQPIHAPPDFDLAERVKAALVDSDNAAATQELADEDDPILAMYKEDATMTPGDPQPPEETVVIPPLPQFEDPPATNDVISKHQFQAREHSKKRRRASASTHPGPSNAKRPLKAAAMRHRDAAVPLHTSTDTSTALETAANTEAMLVDDDVAAAAAASSDSKPIVTDYSLEMDDVPSATTAFQGQRYKQTAADRELKTLQKLRDEGINIIEWKGFDAQPIVDRDDHVFGLLAGQPFDKSAGSGEVPWRERERRMGPWP
ncbi:hypothetical protein LXA43DRAFT_1101416 [Ganoderma leucocontextum]|nr:hypothetical protein LXA43DRAFT_1101416 [Ganoderma leucocontextum]